MNSFLKILRNSRDGMLEEKPHNVFVIFEKGPAIAIVLWFHLENDPLRYYLSESETNYRKRS